MLYNLLFPLADDISVFNLFRYHAEDRRRLSRRCSSASFSARW